MAARASDADRCRSDEIVSTDSDSHSEHVEQVVNELNGICRTSSLEFALKVGAIIIHNFYNGDTAAWRHRGPKLHSFRRLAEHPGLLISPGALYRCVAVFELCDRLRAPARWRRLGASHLRVVIGLPPERQEALLAKANEQRWSVELLQTKARELKANRARGGRRARSPLEKSLVALDQRLQDCALLLEQLGSEDAEELEKNLELLARIGSSMERWVDNWRCRMRSDRG